jgi:hypothetical protein
MRIIKLLPCFCVSLAFACGGDSGGGGNNNGGSTTINSGVDDSKPLSMLSDTELQQIGQSVESAQSSEALLDSVCKLTAKFGASFGASADPNAAPTAAQVEACNDAYAECKADAATMPPEGMSFTEVPNSTDVFAGCNVTVGQYEACLTAGLNLLTQVFGSLSCSSSAMPDLAAAAVQPEACTALASAQCTGALGN